MSETLLESSRTTPHVEHVEHGVSAMSQPALRVTGHVPRERLLSVDDLQRLQVRLPSCGANSGRPASSSAQRCSQRASARTMSGDSTVPAYRPDSSARSIRTTRVNGGVSTPTQAKISRAEGTRSGNFIMVLNQRAHGVAGRHDRPVRGCRLTSSTSKSGYRPTWPLDD